MEVNVVLPYDLLTPSVSDSTCSQSVHSIDYHHPLFLHASDAPSSMSINMPQLGMENYYLWQEAMQLSLLTRNKLGFVDGCITCDTFGKNHELLWDRCNTIIKLWIMHNFSCDLINGVLF